MCTFTFLTSSARTPKYKNVKQLITVALQYTDAFPSLQTRSNALESEGNGLQYSLHTVNLVSPTECNDYSPKSQNLLQ
jgi:hypothetical protein